MPIKNLLGGLFEKLDLPEFETEKTADLELSGWLVIILFLQNLKLLPYKEIYYDIAGNTYFPS